MTIQEDRGALMQEEKGLRELHWNGLEVRFGLANASIVAIGEGIPPVVRQNMELMFSEGRTYSLEREDQHGPEVRSLSYDTFLWEAEHDYPEEWSGAIAQIVVTGAHDNGCMLELRGQGFIGEDRAGGVGISFEGPPQIRLLSSGS